MPLVQLPLSTVKLIGSSQVITSVSSVIKELIENSIDSGANQIEIKLEKHGLDKIEVKDDGCGIGKLDAMVLCLPSYTSKISDFSDLDNLSSFGFRGEALSALCNVAQVCVTTKTAEDEVATCYTYDTNGQVICSKVSHITKGTIVSVTDLFKSLPVRRQFVTSSKRAGEELKKVEKIVKSLAMVHPRLRVTLIHNKFLIWQKTSVSNLRQSVMQVVSFGIVKQLHHILHNTQQMRVEMLVPKKDCDVSSLCFSNFSDAYFLFINNRPIRNKEVEKLVYSKLFEFYGVYVPVNKYPVCVTCLSLPADCLDVNLEPNKTRVYFKNQDDVLDIIKQCMHLYYGDQEKKNEEDKLPATKTIKKRKLEEEFSDLDSKKIILLDDCKSASSGDIEVIEQLVSENTVPVSAENEKQASEKTPDSTAASGLPAASCEEGVTQQVTDKMFEIFCLERNQKHQEDSEIKPINNEFVDIQSDKICTDDVQSVTNKSNSVLSNFLNFESRNTSQTKNQSKLLLNGSLSSYVTTEKQNDKNIVLKSKIKGNCSDLLSCSLKKNNNEVSRFGNAEGSDEYLSPDTSGNDEVCHKQTHDSGGVSDEDIPIAHEQRKHTPDLVGQVQDTTVGVSSPTLSQWSRGEVTTSSGALVKGSCVFTNNPRTASPQTSQALSNRSVSSQMGCKEMSAFTKFARDMRKKILKDQPNMSFIRVAQELQVQWRNLNVDERKKYEEAVPFKKVSNPTTVVEKQKTLPALVNKRPNIELELDIDTLKQMINGTIERKEEVEIHLIGQLEASPLWLYRVGYSGVTVLGVPRLMEAVTFHKHLANFALPIMLLDEFIPFASSDVGDSQWCLLLTLERSPNGVVKDPRFVNNGFLVEILECELEARLTYVPQNISFCGIEELQEVLTLMVDQGPQASLSQCRPLKVISFIRSEVMRECSQEEPPSRPQQVTELLSYWLSHVAPHSQSCIHYQPVTHPLGLT